MQADVLKDQIPAVLKGYDPRINPGVVFVHTEVSAVSPDGPDWWLAGVRDGGALQVFGADSVVVGALGFVEVPEKPAPNGDPPVHPPVTAVVAARRYPLRRRG